MENKQEQRIVESFDEYSKIEEGDIEATENTSKSDLDLFRDELRSMGMERSNYRDVYYFDGTLESRDLEQLSSISKKYGYKKYKIEVASRGSLKLEITFYTSLLG